MAGPVEARRSTLLASTNSSFRPEAAGSPWSLCNKSNAAFGSQSVSTLISTGATKENSTVPASPQRFYGIYLGGAPRGQVAGEQGDAKKEQRRENKGCQIVRADFV
jgi:hypothetical protein